MPITTRELCARGGRLLLGCRCGWQHYVNLSTAPEDTLDRTIADLHRAGLWTCGGCGRRPAAMVYVYDGSMTRQTEHYASSG